MNEEEEDITTPRSGCNPLGNTKMLESCLKIYYFPKKSPAAGLLSSFTMKST